MAESTTARSEHTDAPFELRPLTPTIGAELHNIDPLTDGQIAAIRRCSTTR